MRAATLLAVVFAALLAFPAAGEQKPAPDPGKVLRYVFMVAETGFDPALVTDYFSNVVNEAIFEPLVTYDYLARPAKLVGRAAENAPVAEHNGTVFTFRIKKGIYFADDPAFKGQRRELTAQDFAYSIRRFMDPRLKSPWRYLVEGKIVGLDAIAKAAEQSGRFDYDAPVAGLATPDRYTLTLRLTAPDFNFPYILAMPNFGAVAREIIERYGADTNAHPVGTGPYRLARWVRGSRITLDANPNYRGHSWQFAPAEPGDEKLVAEMRGKLLPTVGRIEIAIIEEDQARLLAFQKGELDLFSLEGPLAPRVLDGDRLKPEFARMGAKLSRIVQPEILTHYFNLRDPVIGGLQKEKIALRRAIAMAYDVQEEIRVLRNGQAIELHYPVPPGVVGHLPAYRSKNATDVKLANALLDRFGYRIGPDGWRTLPDGKPLVIRYTTRPDSAGREQEELWHKSLDKLKIRMQSDKRKFPDILQAEKACRLQMRTMSWLADYPDGDNFMSLFYGKNIGQSNHACVDLPEYDALYEKSVRLPPGPERDALWIDMARLLEVYGAHRMNIARTRNMVVQGRVLGYKKHPILHAEWLYIDIDIDDKGKRP